MVKRGMGGGAEITLVLQDHWRSNCFSLKTNTRLGASVIRRRRLGPWLCRCASLGVSCHTQTRRTAIDMLVSRSVPTSHSHGISIASILSHFIINRVASLPHELEYLAVDKGGSSQRESGCQRVGLPGLGSRLSTCHPTKRSEWRCS